MSPDLPLNAGEHILRSGEHVMIKTGWYRMILTDMRIILISRQTGRPADIDLHDIAAADAVQGPAGNPAIALHVTSAARESRTMIIVFPGAGPRIRNDERDAWVADILNRVPPAVQHVPVAVPRQVPASCSSCGRGLPPGSLFCDRCGAPAGASGTQDGAPGPRQYAGLPYDAVPAKGRTPAPPRRSAEGRIVSRRGTRLKIAAAAGIAAAGLLILVIAAGFVPVPGLTLTGNASGNASAPDIFGFLGMIGNSSAQNQSATSLLSPPENALPAESQPAAATAASTPGAPLAAFDQYIAYYQTGDTASLYGMLSESVKATTSEETVAATVAGELAAGTAYGGYTVISADEQADSAVLVLQDTWIIQGQPAIVTDTVPLVRENGQWKINSLVTAAPPV